MIIRTKFRCIWGCSEIMSGLLQENFASWQQQIAFPCNRNDQRRDIFIHLLSVDVKTTKVVSMEIASLILFLVLKLTLAKDNLSDNSCESKFCEEDPNYPEEILNSFELWRFKFDSVDYRLAKRSLDSNSFITERKLCESNVSFIRPKKLKNVDNQLRTIVNHLNYTQTIMFETCSSENFPCTFDIYPNSVKSFCQQQYTKFELLAYDEDRNGIVTENFLIPSSCDCQIEESDFLKGVKKDLF